MILDLLWSDAVEKEEGLWMFLPVMEGRERVSLGQE